MVALDEELKARGIESIPGIYSGGAEGARAVLATIAGSTITVTGVSFSITIVALTLASTQFGPRLLAHFLRDRGNQFVLGFLLATFMYCLLVLRRVNGLENSEFVPHASVSLGIAFGIMSLGLLIYFINHSAQTIRAEHVIALVGEELDAGIDRAYPSGDEAADVAQERVTPPAGEFASVPGTQAGYIQAIDQDGLVRLAAKHDLVIRINYKAGRFVMCGSGLAQVWPRAKAENLAESVQAAFIIGPSKTSEQDVEFSVHQLVEVALRALSPGINDPFTAINCIDRLGASLSKLVRRAEPPTCRYDEDGKLRIISVFDTFSDLTDAAFNQIRQSAVQNAAVIIRMLEVIGEIMPHARRQSQRTALLRHVAMIERSAERGLPEDEDRKAVSARVQQVHRAVVEFSESADRGAPA